MAKKISFFIIILFIGYGYIFSQENFSIIGTWVITKKQGANKPYYNDITMIKDFSPAFEIIKWNDDTAKFFSFSKNNVFEFRKGNRTYRNFYKIKKDHIKIGNRKFIYKQINNDRLILIDVSPNYSS